MFNNKWKEKLMQLGAITFATIMLVGSVGSVGVLDVEATTGSSTATLMVA